MGVPVPAAPPQGSLAALRVGAPAGATQAALLGSASAFLVGRATQPVCSHGALAAHASAADVYVAYRRRPCVETLRVVAELHPGTATTSRATVAVSLAWGSGSIAWHLGAGTIDLDGGMDGSSPLPAPVGPLADYPTFEGLLDVSQLSVGTVSVLKVTAGDYSASGGRGLVGLCASEVPVPLLLPVDDPTNESGVDAAWTQSGNAIVDGSVSSPRGVGRILRELARARTVCPWHVQIATPTSAPFTRNSTSLGLISVPSPHSSTLKAWRLRARRNRTTSVNNRVRFGAVYRYTPTYAGVANSYFTLDAQSVGGIGLVTTTLAMSATAGAWAHASTTGTIPTDGTNGECELVFQARTENTDGVTTTSSQVEIALLYVIEEET